MTIINDRKSFIHSYTNDEIPMEFVVKFDKVLEELVETFEEEICEDVYTGEEICEDVYTGEDEEFYTEAEIFAEKYSDF